MYNYNIHKISKHSELERIVESLDKKERHATFLLVTDWDVVCGKLLTRLRTTHHSPEFTPMTIYVLDSWDIPDGIAMLRESFDIKSRISKVPCVISIKDNNVAIHSNNDAVYRELGL